METHQNNMLSPLGRAVVEMTQAVFGIASQAPAPKQTYVKPDYDTKSLGVGACGFHPILDEVM